MNPRFQLDHHCHHRIDLGRMRVAPPRFNYVLAALLLLGAAVWLLAAYGFVKLISN